MSSASAYRLPVDAPKRPNVLWIMCDQLRYHALSAAGDPNIETPNIDRIGREGATCRNAYVTWPLCTPQRACMVTGLYNHANGVVGQGELLLPGVPTIAHAFRAAGYRTCWMGKWHLGSSDAGPNNSYWVHPALRGGFEEWYGFDFANTGWNTRYSANDEIRPYRVLEGFQTDGLTNLAVDWLGEAGAKSEPWFACVSYEAPHPLTGPDGTPGERPNGEMRCEAPAEYLAMFDADSLSLRQNVPREDGGLLAFTRDELVRYYAMVKNVDDNVGLLLDALSAAGSLDSTIVVFFADHGEHGGSHGTFGKGAGFEEDLHIPLMIRYPKRIAPGTEYEGLVGGLDIFPTTAGLAGVPVRSAVHGVNHTPALNGTAGPPRDRLMLQWTNRHLHPWSRTSRYGLVRNKAIYLTTPDAPDRYWDLRADPFQERDGEEGFADLDDASRDALANTLAQEMIDVGIDPETWSDE